MGVIVATFLAIFKFLAVVSLVALGFYVHALLDLPPCTRILAVLPGAVLFARFQRPDPWSVMTPYPGFFFLCLLFTPLLSFSSHLETGSSIGFSSLLLLAFPAAFFFPYPLLDRTIARWQQNRPPRLTAWASPFADHGPRNKMTLAPRHRPFKLS